MNKLFTLLALFLISVSSAFAEADVEMAFDMRSNGKIYVVVAVLATIFTGLAIFLFLLDRRISKLEKQHNIDND
ncbi:MAG: CcmD family protein [Bacteroidetes bacterium]|nr:MAG: CcmD family protein [Bacteroidota bacterium]